MHDSQFSHYKYNNFQLLPEAEQNMQKGRGLTAGCAFRKTDSSVTKNLEALAAIEGNDKESGIQAESLPNCSDLKSLQQLQPTPVIIEQAKRLGQCEEASLWGVLLVNIRDGASAGGVITLYPDPDKVPTV